MTAVRLHFGFLNLLVVGKRWLQRLKLWHGLLGLHLPIAGLIEATDDTLRDGFKKYAIPGMEVDLTIDERVTIEDLLIEVTSRAPLRIEYRSGTEYPWKVWTGTIMDGCTGQTLIEAISGIIRLYYPDIFRIKG